MIRSLIQAGAWPLKAIYVRRRIYDYFKKNEQVQLPLICVVAMTRMTEKLQRKFKQTVNQRANAA